MTPAEFIDWTQAIDLSAFPVHMTIERPWTKFGWLLDGSWGKGVAITVVLRKLRHRDGATGELALDFDRLFDPSELKKETFLLWLRDIVTHELLECLLVNGEREFDPHDRDKIPSFQTIFD